MLELDMFSDILSAYPNQKKVVEDKFVFYLIRNNHKTVMKWIKYAEIPEVEIQTIYSGLGLTFTDFIAKLSDKDRLVILESSDNLAYLIERREDGSLQIWPE